MRHRCHFPSIFQPLIGRFCLAPVRTWRRPFSTTISTRGSPRLRLVHLTPETAYLVDANGVQVDKVQNDPTLSHRDELTESYIRPLVQQGRLDDALAVYKKRRLEGFTPSMELQRSMFQSLAAMRDAQRFVDDARSLFTHYVVQPEDRLRAPSVIFDYLTVLCSAKQFSEAVHTFAALDDEVRADPRIYRTVFSILAAWVRSTSSEEDLLSCADYAATLWQNIPPAFVVDAEFLDDVLHILVTGSKVHHTLGLTIVSEWIDSGRITPERSLIYRVAKLYKCAKEHDRLITWTRKLLEQQPELPSNDHISFLFHAFALTCLPTGINHSSEAIAILRSRAAISIPPSQGMYTSAMAVTWIGRDWLSAREVFKIMTGRALEDYSNVERQLLRRKHTHAATSGVSKDSEDMPSAERYAFSQLGKAALASGSVWNILEYLRFIRRLDDPWTIPREKERPLHHVLTERAALVDQAQTVLTMVQKVDEAEDGEVSATKAQMVADVKKRAMRMLRSVKNLPNEPSPVTEEINAAILNAAHARERSVHAETDDKDAS